MEKAMKHDFSGSCVPGQGSWNQTFSVGIFQWIPKSSGKGLKKSAVKFRVSGPSSEKDVVFRKARQICDDMDKGTFKLKTKSMTV